MHVLVLIIAQQIERTSYELEKEINQNADDVASALFTVCATWVAGTYTLGILFYLGF